MKKDKKMQGMKLVNENREKEKEVKNPIRFRKKEEKTKKKKKTKEKVFYGKGIKLYFRKSYLERERERE